jgi:hypothetical protein
MAYSHRRSCRGQTLLSVACVMAACAPSVPQNMSEVVGCYRLVWSYSSLADSAFRRMMPRSLVLDTLGSVGKVQPRVVGTWGDSSWWQLTPGRPVEVFWSAGLAGLRFELESHGDTLDGAAIMFADHPGEYRMGHVEALPVSCTSR